MRSAAELGATVLLAALALGGRAAAADIEVRARLEPRRIGLEDVARLIIEVQGGALDELGFEPEFKLENLQIAGGASRGSQISSINGRISRVESIHWPVRPLALGTGRVHALRVTVGEVIASPAALEVEIVEGSLAPSRPRRDPWRDPFPDLFAPFRQETPAAEPKLFLRAEAHPTDPYVGEQVTYVLYLFSQADVSSIHPEKLPDFRGFWVQEVEETRPREPEIVDVNGERYARVALLRRMLFPLRPGRLTIDAVRVQIGIQPRRLGFGHLDRGVAVWRTTNGLDLDVGSLPEGPDGFEGAVGRLRVAAELHPGEVGIGEAATFTVTLSGSGHLQGLAAPPLPDLEGVRAFPPQQESDERIVGNRVESMKAWSWVLLPDRSGRWWIPETRLPYFDPEAEEFRWATAAGQVLVATAGAGTVRESGAPSPSDGPPAPANAETEPPAWAASAGRVAAIALVCCGLVLAALLLRRRPRPQATAGLRQALQEARRAPDPRRAAARVEEALRSLLEQRWAIGPGTPSTRWPDLLQDRGAAAETAAQVGRLGDDLHYLRYAPQLAEADELLRDLLRRCRKLARALQ